MAAVAYQVGGDDIEVSLLTITGGTGETVNTTLTNVQETPDVAMDAAGNFVVVWADASTVPTRVLGRLYDSNGDPTSGELPLSDAGEEAVQPEVAMDADGDFVAIWEWADGDGDGVEARVFNEAGAPQSAEIAVNPAPEDDQDDADVAVDADGDFAVVYESGSADQDVVGRVFSETGVAATGQFPLASTTAGDQNGPKVAMNDAGDQIIVGWDGNGAGDDEGVYHRRFNAAGTPLTAEGLVNVTTVDDQEEHAVAADAAGNYVFSWEMADADEEGIFVRRFNLPSPGGPGGPGGPTGDIASRGKITANGKRVVVNVTCLAAVCNFTGGARVTVPNKALKKKKKASAAKAFKLKQATSSLTQGQSGKLTIRLNKKAKRRPRRPSRRRNSARSCGPSSTST
jgi:hypothetical protein